MGYSNKKLTLPFLCIFFMVSVLVFIDRAGAQSQPGGQTASPSVFRLVGTVEGGPFSGAVIDDGTGVQAFYRIHAQLPDGSQLLKVQKNSIIVKRDGGMRYEIFITRGANSAIAAMPSQSVTPALPQIYAPDSEKKTLQRQKRSGRAPETDD